MTSGEAGSHSLDGVGSAAKRTCAMCPAISGRPMRIVVRSRMMQDTEGVQLGMHAVNACCENACCGMGMHEGSGNA